MERFARIIQKAGGFLLFLHLFCFFLPFLTVTQENYPTISLSQFSYIKNFFEREMEKGELLIALLLVALPLFLSVVMGLWNILSSRRRIIPGIGTVAVSLLDVSFLWKSNLFYPERINDAQNFQKGYGFFVLVAISCLYAVIGILIILTSVGRKKANTAEIIPDVAQIHRDQLKPQYEFIDESRVKQETAASSQENPEKPVSSKGMMVGITGVFQGAEIPFNPGETLKLGRDNSNDLIFTQAARVSRCHCEITWYPEKNKFMILDHSSNGCFVNGREECIPQNIAIELEPGTILDVGDQNNRFRLG